MRWIAIAATVENYIVAANDDLILLETAAEMDFDIIVRVYGVSDDEYSALKSKNLEFRLRFNNFRSTYLEPITRPKLIKDLSKTYDLRIQHMDRLKGRFEHALNRYRNFLSKQNIIYSQKVEEAQSILNDATSRYIDDGYVKDYSDDTGMDVFSAANLIVTKDQNRRDYLRKIERLRIKHFTAAKILTTAEEFDAAWTEVDRDFFVNMLM